jgi:hypothetical protein
MDEEICGTKIVYIMMFGRLWKVCTKETKYFVPYTIRQNTAHTIPKG